MGLLYHAVKIPRFLSFTFFLSIFANARYLFTGALTRLGLYKPPPRGEGDESANSRDILNNYILIIDSSSVSFVPVPVRVIVKAIKSILPIVHYQDLMIGRVHDNCDDENEEGGENEEDDDESLSLSSLFDEERTIRTCTICLESIELEHDVRELCNCKHMFHRACLDRWVDEGQITCPLCRSMLLPPKTIIQRYHRASRQAYNNSSVVAS